MKKFFKQILSQEFINNFYHLPKAVLANIVYGFPTKGLYVIGVTGTDGKSTTVNMIYRILKAAGEKVSMVSTINAVIGDKAYDTGFHVTSPDPFAVQKLAKQAFSAGSKYLILEVTSHALDQYRFYGIKFNIGVVTNITHEHLDYHKTMSDYSLTKLKLLKNIKYAVVNQNIRQQVKDVLGKNLGKLITFGKNNGDFNQKDIKLKLKIPGDYNVENALSALSVAFVLNIDKNMALAALENFRGIKGRMEEIENTRAINVIVDFAHTPNALTQALQTLKDKARGRLIAVFGSAGKRDVVKRGLMGQIAAKEADFMVVTSEDPRGESETIEKQIVQGAQKAGATLGRNLFIVRDREQAIDFAINKLSKKGDTVGIFGKGHEASMNLDGKKEIPWSDFEAARKVLNEPK